MYVYWTNREDNTYCDINTETNLHEYENALGVTWGERPVVHILQVFGDSATERKACMAIVLAHEIAHTLGMYEAYEDLSHEVDEMRCVMEYYEKDPAVAFYTNVMGNSSNVSPFCSSCLSTMKALTASIGFSVD